MADRLEGHAKTFKSLYNVLSQYPDEAFLMINEKQKIVLFSSFFNLDKQLRTIKGDEIVELLKKLTAKLYGVKMDTFTGGKK